MLKYLRIAVFALSLTACVLLVALWVRTAFAMDLMSGPVGSNRSLNIGSLNGAVGVRLLDQDSSEWTRISLDPGTPVPLPFNRILGFGGIVHFQSSVFWIRVPYWFLFLMNGVALVILLHRDRMSFSLHTLLIATTLIAVVMGMVIYLAR